MVTAAPAARWSRAARNPSSRWSPATKRWTTASAAGVARTAASRRVDDAACDHTHRHTSATSASCGRGPLPAAGTVPRGAAPRPAAVPSTHEGRRRGPTVGVPHRREEGEMDAAAAQVVTEGLEAAGLEVDEVDEGRWMTMLSGEWKRTIPVLLRLEDRHLTVSSLFAGVPDEQHAEVYRLLLQRNQRPLPVHFALDDEGDLVLVGRVPLAALDATTFDELLGALLTLADETFNQVLRAGFASYLDAEQRWREKAGMPPNPVGQPRRAEG
ncbi:hypothetical protein FTX61_03335 [Nitriliruptoraceae bacterium ZYF776]|nr:hypothetical protein [Profundirhabdus halotolerans]